MGDRREGKASEKRKKGQWRGDKEEIKTQRVNKGRQKGRKGKYSDREEE